MRKGILVAPVLAACLAIPTAAADRQAFFGDLHVHTSWSLDSYIFGNNNDPEAAYRFARGAAVPLALTEQKRQLERPLDFAAVTDHAETLGYFQLCMVDRDTPVAQSEMCQLMQARDLKLYFMGFKRLAANPPQHMEELCATNEACRKAAMPPWQALQAIAEKYNTPGEFTTFKGYEYTGNLPAGGMLHRNVIFAGSNVPDEALSAFDLPTARELWAWLEQSCTGDCDVITIPHNSNLSWGQTFALRNVAGSEWSEQDQRRRQGFDRLAEIFQAKGDSECRTGIGTEDEFCNFENLLGPCAEGEATGCMRYTSFVRNGLRMGLQLEAQLGFNPYAYGIIGSTDTHNGTPGDTAEVGYMGHNGGEATLQQRLAGGHRRQDGRGAINYNPGGLAGAWAEENTRASLFAAFKRRETFGTSGNRIRIRLFAGDYPDDLLQKPDAIARAYALGVPMGETLELGENAAAPALLAWAEQDPDAGPLQRLQIVKGWMDASGETHDTVFDVACAGGVQPDSTSHRCPDNRAKVSRNDCNATADSGASQLAAVWKDPTFDPRQRAFYYARVLENPTCRWSSYDLLTAKGAIEPSSDVPWSVQERAWSSPVWLAPKR